MNYYWLVILFLYTGSLAIVMSKHGEPKNEKHNFWVSLISDIFEIALIYCAIKTGF